MGREVKEDIFTAYDSKRSRSMECRIWDVFQDSSSLRMQGEKYCKKQLRNNCDVRNTILEACCINIAIMTFYIAIAAMALMSGITSRKKLHIFCLWDCHSTAA
jgi:hypothetical protein